MKGLLLVLLAGVAGCGHPRPAPPPAPAAHVQEPRAMTIEPTIPDWMPVCIRARTGGIACATVGDIRDYIENMRKADPQ